LKSAPLSPLWRFFRPSLDKNEQHVFSWHKFLHHYWKALGWIFLLTFFVHVMEVAGLLNGFEIAPLDRLLRLNPREMSTKVVIVEITDEDYKNPALFGGKSPLDSGKLMQLVSNIQGYGPTVIGMDFDTESPDAWNANSASLATDLSVPPRTPVVWAEVPCNIVEPLVLGPVLGGRFSDPNHLGIPRFPVDSDGVVRRYQGKFQVTGTFKPCAPKFIHTTEADAPSSETATGTMFSFARAVIQHACKDKKCDGDSLQPVESAGLSTGVKAALRHVCFGNVNCLSLLEDRAPSVIFNFYGDRYRFPIIQSHEFIGPDAVVSPVGNLQSQRENPLRGKIVLIGGSFSAARDVYMTPLGQMAGVELIALAVQSDFGGGIRETQKILEIFADIFVGSIIVFLYFYYQQRPLFAFYASLLGVPVLTTLFSFVLFKTAAYWFNFVPIVIGMVMHQMLELSKTCRELQHEVHKLTRKLHESTESSFRINSAQASQEAVPRQETIEPPVGKQPNTKV
jgi:CHASE2 domain-containing sensor protein